MAARVLPPLTDARAPIDSKANQPPALPGPQEMPEEIRFVRAQSLILEGTSCGPVVQVPCYLFGWSVELGTQSVGRPAGRSVVQSDSSQ